MTSMQILQTLLEITVYSAVLFACIMVFKTICKQKLSATLSFVLWFLLIVRLCVPVTIQSAFHLFTLPQQQQQAAQEAPSASALQQVLAAPEQIASQYVPVQQKAVQQTSEMQTVQTAPQQTALPAFTVYDWIALLWLGGVCVFGCWTIGLSVRIARVIKNKSVPAPAEIKKLYASCREELGIKQRPPLLVTQNLLSPALVVSARPTILLPGSFLKHAPQEQIQLALLHELAHYKRRDHWLCILLRVLSVLYWFNPVLWLAEKEIAADMETACDNRIVKGMQKEEKAYYANTILSMFSAKTQTPFVLGLALPNTKRVAEKRIRGIYMKSKTRKSVKFSALLLAVVLIAACFTTACQPAQAEPDAAPASSASALAVQAMASAAPVTAQSPQPSASDNNKYKDTKKLSDIVTVNYNADVVQPKEVPEATMKIRDFTEADVQKVVDYFFAGKQTNAPWVRTKAQLQAEIDSYTEQNNQAVTKRNAFLAANPWAEKVYEGMKKAGGTGGIDSKVWDPIKAEYSLADTDENTYMTTVASVQSTTGMNNYWIKKDQEEFKTAPDTEQKTPAVIQFKNTNLGNVAGVESGVETKSDHDIIVNQVKVWSENSDGTISEVFGQKNINGINSRISFCRQLVNGIYTFVLNDNKPLTMLQDQAQKLAVDAVAAICPEMALSGASIGQYKQVDGFPNINGYYTFSFTRNVCGVPITYDSNGGYMCFTNNGQNETIYEQIQVNVDNQGIISMDWYNPYANIQVTNQNATILNQQQAQQAFEKNLLTQLAKQKYTGSKSDSPFAMDKITININRIVLGLTRVTEKDGSYKLIPTWDFFGEAHAFNGLVEQQFNHFGQTAPTLSLGTVNALDGSEIIRPGDVSNW